MGWLRRISARSRLGSALLALYGAACLLGAFAFPWWRMENRAPQYGMRVLTVQVSPLGVEGDIKEIDGLGHYVGMRPMEAFARVERTLSPWALCAVALGLMAAPFLRSRSFRALAVAATVAVPLGFAADLWYWQQYAVTHLDPTAALNKIADRIQARLIGEYSVAQFHVRAQFDTGFWLTVVAAGNAIGFLVAEWNRRGPARRAASAVEPSRTAGSGRRFAAPSAAAFIVLAIGDPYQSAILDVGAGARYSSVQAAIRAARPGDEIRVHAGTYREHIVVDRSLIVCGDRGAVIDGAGQGTVVLVQDASASIFGLTIRGSGASLLDEDAGVKLLRASDSVVEGNHIEDALFGILVHSSPHARVAANRVAGKHLPVERQGDGIRLQDASDSEIAGNEVECSRDFAIWQSHRCVAKGNVVRRCRYGLHTMYCDDVVIDGNVFDANRTGGAVMYGRRMAIRGNHFSAARGPSAHGLLLKVADDVQVEDNWFLDNTNGIFLEDSPSSLRSSCTVRRNVIAGNDCGIALQPSVARTVIAENAFVSNRVQVIRLGRRQGADRVCWSDRGRGNYWSDYVGFDADGDGIGDSPHRVESFFETLADRWPAVGLLRMGPAVEALESAARAFPIVKAEAAAFDEHPLVRPPAELAASAVPRPEPYLAAAGALSIAASSLALARSRRFGVSRGGT